jgi:hypothetical protein
MSVNHDTVELIHAVSTYTWVACLLGAFICSALVLRRATAEALLARRATTDGSTSPVADISYVQGGHDPAGGDVHHNSGDSPCARDPSPPLQQ